MAEKQTDKRKLTYTATAEECVRIECGNTVCAIEPTSGCCYAQRKYDVGNFIRHFRTQHPVAAMSKNLLKETESPVKRARPVTKQSFPIDKRLFYEACLKLVTQHHLPFNCFEWDGFKMLMDPIMETLNCHVNRRNIKIHIHETAQKVRSLIKDEMVEKLVSIKIDSASRHGRHMIGLNVQYEANGEVVIRTLGKT